MNQINIVKKLATDHLPAIIRISESIYKLEGEIKVNDLHLNDRSDLLLLLELMDSLDDLRWKIETLHNPVLAEGILYKNSSGRYQIDDNHYFTSGSSIELLTYDDFYENKVWVRTRIEHNGDDYYAVRLPNTPLGNLQARVRG